MCLHIPIYLQIILFNTSGKNIFDFLTSSLKLQNQYYLNVKILLFVLSDCRPLPPCPDNIDVRSQTEYIPGKTCKIAPQPVELPPKEKWRLTATPDQIRLVDSARENGNMYSKISI